MDVKNDAKKFVDNLEKEGDRVRCDDSQEFFRKMELPGFYDKTKFRRGQKFFHDNIFAMFYGKFLGLISDLAVPDVLEILKYTKKSSEPETAFKRYVGTIFHMCTWYSSELKPDTKLWESLVKVRRHHNSASKMCRSHDIGQITQRQMALAQFGFIGYILTRPKVIGLHRITDEDLEGFVHFWRVVGHLLGVEERFNICRETVQETRSICEAIIEQVIGPLILKWDPSFLHMTAALTDGLWCMMPILNRNVCLQYLYEMVKSDENDKPAVILNCSEKFVYYFMKSIIYILKFDLVRIIHNYNLYLILYCTKRFPFLAYLKFNTTDFYIKRYVRQKI